MAGQFIFWSYSVKAAAVCNREDKIFHNPDRAGMAAKTQHEFAASVVYRVRILASQTVPGWFNMGCGDPPSGGRFKVSVVTEGTVDHCRGTVLTISHFSGRGMSEVVY